MDTFGLMMEPIDLVCSSSRLRILTSRSVVVLLGRKTLINYIDVSTL